MEYSISSQIGEQVYEDITYIARYNIDWERFRNKTILVTGANGFIAYYMILAFLLRNDLYGENIKVLGLVRNLKKASEKFGALLKREDIKLINQDVTENMEQIEHADFVIHAASQASAYYFETDPVGTIEANTTGTINVLKYAVAQKSEAVLIVSSLKVYGTIKNGGDKLIEDKLGELDITSYKNCYAQGKRLSETLCSSFAKQYGVPVKIARPSYIYGASTMDDDRVWAQFLANVIRGENILLKSSGAVYRSFCYVIDTVTALLKIMLEGEIAVPYNIAAEHSDTTIRNFAKTAIEAFPERKISLQFANKVDEQEPDVDTKKLAAEILDSTRLEKLGWRAEITLLEGVQRAVRTMEERLES